MTRAFLFRRRTLRERVLDWLFPSRRRARRAAQMKREMLVIVRNPAMRVYFED